MIPIIFFLLSSASLCAMKHESLTHPWGTHQEALNTMVKNIINSEHSFSFDQETIESFLKQGVDPNFQNANGVTLLHKACAQNKFNVIAVLIGYEANVNIADTHGRTPLYYAVQYKHTHAAQLLIEHGADIYTHDNEGNSLLHINPSGYIGKLLTQGELNINPQNNAGETPLISLCKTPDPNYHYAILLLENKNTHIDEPDHDGNTALHMLCRQKIVHDKYSLFNSKSVHVEITHLLLAHGASANHRTKKGYTPLHTACSGDAHNNIALIKLLLEAKADVNTVRGRHMRTPLYTACEHNKEPEIIETLLDSGADVQICGYTKETPLFVAQNNQTASLLIQHGACIHARALDHATPLHAACADGREQVAQLLLEQGAHLFAVDRSNKTPYEYAQNNSMKKILRNAAIRKIKADQHAHPTHNTTIPDLIAEQIIAYLD